MYPTEQWQGVAYRVLAAYCKCKRWPSLAFSLFFDWAPDASSLPFRPQLQPSEDIMEDSPSHRTPARTPSRQQDRKRMTRQDTIDGASNTELALAQTRMWIEVRPIW